MTKTMCVFINLNKDNNDKSNNGLIFAHYICEENPIIALGQFTTAIKKYFNGAFSPENFNDDVTLSITLSIEDREANSDFILHDDMNLKELYGCIERHLIDLIYELWEE